ncbi:hypothetical protein CP981_02815 [Streptomyces platensis]|nr:hypothetical protein [Streptomyces platensis]QEV50741.1 hypothetical protein CP981_02815 [Streptomyces platensis]
MTAPQHGPLADAPLEQLFPEAGEGDLELIRLEGARMDAALGPKGPARWEWEPGVLCTDITVGDATGDRVEYSLQVDCSESTSAGAFAGVSVACGCEENHETHLVHTEPVYLTELTSLYEGTELGMAFTFLVWELVGWIENPTEPAAWRARKGLPAPRATAVPGH